MQKLLGHKSLKNTLVYTHLVDIDTDESYVVKVASNIDEFTSLLKSGFEYIADYDYAIFARTSLAIGRCTLVR